MIMAAPKPDPQQEELAFSSIAPHAVFPGRRTLYVQEVAEHLKITSQHVLNLIELGELKAVNIASDISGGPTDGKSRRASARHYRIPVSALDEFLQARRNSVL